MQRQTMAGIKLLPAPQGFNPIFSQRELQSMYRESKPLSQDQSGEAETVGELMERIRFNHEADAMEKAEMLEWLPWKAWKSYDGVTHETLTVDADEIINELKFELIDRFHFMLNEAIALGMTWHEFLMIFYTKQEENRRRQRDGY